MPNSFEVSATPSDSRPSLHLTPVFQWSTAGACLLQQPTDLSSTDGATVLFQQTTQSRQSRQLFSSHFKDALHGLFGDNLDKLEIQIWHLDSSLRSGEVSQE
ncbi:hypothetical protein EmuJ_000417000 [Echinococcus multilocularis]|uniref:Uncharacterized protein n=1 Tax=Echinococcus multilocularis TaxID=6211 RepID=A0A068Y3V8_ECHMU|nr:hypothetical protein EmuJ_000417000 [Echinococcus multilocularis]